MPPSGNDQDISPSALLSADEPAPSVVLNGSSTTPILLVCDHACRRFPAALGTLGLDPFARRCHLAIDIGAGPLTERIAAELGVTAVLCQYSRLVVDCNRQLMDPGAFLQFGDGIVIPGNCNLHQDEKDQRANEIYWPYHQVIDAEIKRLSAAGRQPVFVSIHSFTPVLNGESRSWEMGVLWDTDPVTAEIFVRDLRDAGYLVGDNEPYSGKAPQDFTVDHHAEDAGLSHVGIEIRQDLIDSDSGVETIAAILGATISSLPARIKPTNISDRQPAHTG